MKLIWEGKGALWFISSFPKCPRRPGLYQAVAKRWELGLSPQWVWGTQVLSNHLWSSRKCISRELSLETGAGTQPWPNVCPRWSDWSVPPPWRFEVPFSVCACAQVWCSFPPTQLRALKRSCRFGYLSDTDLQACMCLCEPLTSLSPGSHTQTVKEAEKKACWETPESVLCCQMTGLREVPPLCPT